MPEERCQFFDCYDPPEHRVVFGETSVAYCGHHTEHTQAKWDRFGLPLRVLPL